MPHIDEHWLLNEYNTLLMYRGWIHATVEGSFTADAAGDAIIWMRALRSVCEHLRTLEYAPLTDAQYFELYHDQLIGRW